MKSSFQILPLAIQIMALLLVVSCNSNRGTISYTNVADSVRIVINPKNVSKVSFFDHFSEKKLVAAVSPEDNPGLVRYRIKNTMPDGK